MEGDTEENTGFGLPGSQALSRVVRLIEAGRCVVLDGGTATELATAVPLPDSPDEPLWGLRALVDAPDAVLRVHERYLAAGSDVISTSTWGLSSALTVTGAPRSASTLPMHWMDVARRGLAVGHEAIARQGRTGECALAFSVNSDLDSEDGRAMVPLLARVLAEQPPDLILLETLSLLRPSLDETVEALLATGLPVWLSFRRCRHGMCGVFGQHWGGPEGDAFGRAARRFEAMGVGALLVNCIPPDHVDGMVGYLRDYTDLPLGVYPNLGYHTSAGWRFDPGVAGEQYAEMALGWREEGAQIIGGCCGVGPDHIAAVSRKLAGTRPGSARVRLAPAEVQPAEPAETHPRWADSRHRPLYPLPFPDIAVDPGVYAPGEGGFLAWRYLFDRAVGARQRCLDVGCGTGLLAVQLALNGATHVRALDIDPRAAANARTNAFRNGVSERVTAAAVDLYPWVPEERYEVIVASPYQAPADPFGRVTTYGPVDFWGRSFLDQLISKLPDALAPEGVVYVVQLSILSQQRTVEILAATGFTSQVVDYQLFRSTPELRERAEQIRRVEDLSDAYHLQVGGHDVMVAYLLEVTHARAAPNQPGREAVRGSGAPDASGDRLGAPPA
ncbi:MAG: homocysteine S-methyltransferase family protein, partial [Solirubrobacterales bacterium]|nr:homocysteine S-methyltransferase family protein [Solirubrobacterales bacterium]